MTKGGIIIRLIDVAMIILFGFIAISDLKVRTQIKLPARQEQPEPQTKPDPMLLAVRIGMDNSFVIMEGESFLSQTASLQELEKILVNRFRQLQNAGTEMVVLIEPDGDSVIQRTVDVLDICERHHFPMNLNYQSAEF